MPIFNTYQAAGPLAGTETVLIWQDSAVKQASVDAVVGAGSGVYVPLAGGTVTGTLAIVQGAASTVALSTKVTGDAANRWQVTEDGTQSWGDGTNPLDVSLARTAANVLSVGTGDQLRASHVVVNLAAGGLGTVEKLRVNTWTVADNTANVVLAASAANAKPLMVQMFVAQTANAQEWQSSTGTSVAQVGSNGSVWGSDFKLMGPTKAYYSASGASYAMYTNSPNTLLVAYSAAHVPLVVRGVAAQTGNLFEAQDSASAVLASISAAGVLRVNSTGTPGTVEKFRVNTPTTVVNTVSTMFTAASAADVPIGVQTAAAATLGYISGTTSAGVQDFYIDSYFRGNGLRNLAAASYAQILTTTAGPFIARDRADAITALRVQQVHASSTGPIVEFQNNTGIVATVTQAGLHRWVVAGNVQTTVGAAGGASALPATPTKYLKVVDDTGATLVIPAYAAA